MSKVMLMLASEVDTQALCAAELAAAEATRILAAELAAAEQVAAAMAADPVLRRNRPELCTK